MPDGTGPLDQFPGIVLEVENHAKPVSINKLATSKKNKSKHNALAPVPMKLQLGLWCINVLYIVFRYRFLWVPNRFTWFGAVRHLARSLQTYSHQRKFWPYLTWEIPYGNIIGFRVTKVTGPKTLLPTRLCKGRGKASTVAMEFSPLLHGIYQVRPWGKFPLLC